MGVSRSRYIVRFFIIQLLGCLGWLCDIASAQLDLAAQVTGSVSSPDIAFAFMGNLAVFVTSLFRRRLDLEIGARDVLATMRVPGQNQLDEINDGFGLTTCEQRQQDRFAKASVVMLSYDPPNSSMKQFMTYLSGAYKVYSILLQCFPLKSKSDQLLPGICNCIHDDTEEYKCNCIVFWNVEDIVMVLARRMPGTLKRLSDSLCLLPSPQCLKTGCHGCIQAQLPVEETDESGSKILTEGDIEKGNKAVKEIFEYISGGAMKGAHPCICIPLSPSGYDQWTQLLTRSLGVSLGVGYRAFSINVSFIAPRLAEVLLNIVLTGWFRVDGLSSALVARWAIKDYVVQGGGFAAGAFLTKGLAKNNNECRVLNFRGILSGTRTFSFIIGSVNLLCFISWIVLVSFQGWYDTRSISPSIIRVVIIMVAIGIALGMDCLHLYVRRSRHAEEFRPRNMVRGVIILEMMCILFLFGIILTDILGIKVVGRWIYGALQVLVGVKWVIGSYLLGDHPPEYDHDSQFDYDNGILVYSSAFLLNFVLAGVRCNWNYSLSSMSN